jgi:hypothetical protein
MANDTEQKPSLGMLARAGVDPKLVTQRKHLQDETSARPAFVACPVCHVGYKCHFTSSMLDNVEDGIARVLLTPPCGHKLLVFVDGNLRPRGIERIDRDGVVCEHADTTFLDMHVKQLEEKHALLARSENSYNEAFDMMQQIKRAKKELDTLRNKIVVK